MENELPERKPIPWYRQRKLFVGVVSLFILSLVALSGSQYIRASDLQVDNENKSDTIDSLNGDLKSKQAKVTGLESQTADLNEKVAALEATIRALQEGTDGGYEAPTYGLTINSVSTEPIIVTGTEDERDKYLYVTVTITNTSSSEGYVGPLDFTLKNLEGEKRSNYKEHSYYNSYYSKAGLAELLGQPLAGGDTAKGALLFIVGKNDQNFTLRYGNQAYEISSN